VLVRRKEWENYSHSLSFFIPLGWSGQARQTKKERREAKRDYSTRDLTNFSICT
jgi:hypothetical protein